MKHFYIVRGHFAKTYNLYWAPRGVPVPGGEQVTSAEAVKLCKAERKRRKSDPYFNGYANAYIMPYGCREAENPSYILRHTDSSGFIVL